MTLIQSINISDPKVLLLTSAVWIDDVYLFLNSHHLGFYDVYRTLESKLTRRAKRAKEKFYFKKNKTIYQI